MNKKIGIGLLVILLAGLGVIVIAVLVALIFVINPGRTTAQIAPTQIAPAQSAPTQSAQVQGTPTQSAPGQQPEMTMPEKLFIPRWFLTSLTLQGQPVELIGPQAQSIQFTPDGKVNGQGGCNSFGGTYQAGFDGKLTFGDMVRTEMACADGMTQENAYLQALGQVQHFTFNEQMKLVLTSEDGKTSLIFSRPPK